MLIRFELERLATLEEKLKKNPQCVDDYWLFLINMTHPIQALKDLEIAENATGEGGGGGSDDQQPQIPEERPWDDNDLIAWSLENGTAVTFGRRLSPEEWRKRDRRPDDWR